MTSVAATVNEAESPTFPRLTTRNKQVAIMTCATDLLELLNELVRCSYGELAASFDPEASLHQLQAAWARTLAFAANLIEEELSGDDERWRMFLDRVLQRRRDPAGWRAELVRRGFDFTSLSLPERGAQ